MAQILTGRINLSKIPEELVKRNANGEAFVWVDVVDRREPSQYGDTHNITIYDSANRQKIYIGELRPRDIGGAPNAPDNKHPKAGTAVWGPNKDLMVTKDDGSLAPVYPDSKYPAPVAPKPMNNAQAELDPSDPDDMDIPF